MIITIVLALALTAVAGSMFDGPGHWPQNYDKYYGPKTEYPIKQSEIKKYVTKVTKLISAEKYDKASELLMGRYFHRINLPVDYWLQLVAQHRNEYLINAGGETLDESQMQPLNELERILANEV